MILKALRKLEHEKTYTSDMGHYSRCFAGEEVSVHNIEIGLLTPIDKCVGS